MDIDLLSHRCGFGAKCPHWSKQEVLTYYGIISPQRFKEKHHCLLYFIYTFFILFKWSVSCVPHLCQSFGQGWLFNNSVEKCILLSAVRPKVKQIIYIYMDIYDLFLICGALNCSVLLKSKCVSPANENILLGLYVSLSKAKSVFLYTQLLHRQTRLHSTKRVTQLPTSVASNPLHYANFDRKACWFD